ncbi:hypothetical protein HCN73_04985 [Lactobacillus crispatus]|uniref:hypothetical protein n=1 Tax=Lactobacillus crispatus TaxID=47770 RepID=UPI0015EC6A46|nr:hypothetical protein [Lactobacillus crispatus]MBA2915539.1 hypothetical protein [Lactobacillus crispatus]MBA2915699.1 hypothetical protein [Lactobacillus crispatus]
MISISDVISLIENAIKLSKKVKDKDLNNILLELQAAVLQFGTQNLELQDKYSKLKKYIEIPDNVYLDDDGFLCRKNDKVKYCASCWNKDRRLSLMPKKGTYNLMAGDFNTKSYTYECSACKYQIYSDKEQIY